MEQFESEINPLKASILEGTEVIDDLRYSMDTFRYSAISEYRANASSYYPEICQQKEKNLLEKLNERLHVFFAIQLENLHKKAIQMFKLEVKVTNRYYINIMSF